MKRAITGALVVAVVSAITFLQDSDSTQEILLLSIWGAVTFFLGYLFGMEDPKR